MKVVTWNIKGRAAHWRARRRTMAAEIRDVWPDVVALQECASRFRHQSVSLGGDVRMRAHHAGTVALLSRERARIERRLLPGTARGGSKRMLVAKLERVEVWVVHLPLDADVRRACADQLAVWSQTVDRPIVLCGDINETPEGGVVEVLTHAGFVDAWTAAEPGYTFPADAPRARIDVVLARGLTPTGARVLDARASDHLGVVATFTG